MKLLILLTVVSCLRGSACGFGQTVTLSLNNTPLEQAFKEIKKQTGYTFVYTRGQLKNTISISCHFNHAPLMDALSVCFRDQPLSFIIEDRYIVIQKKTPQPQPSTPQTLPINISGHITNNNGDPVTGATIQVKSSGKLYFTDTNGDFFIENIGPDDVLIVSAAEMESQQVKISGHVLLKIILNQKIGKLDETIVIGYGTTTRRLSTGSVAKVSGEEISKQPVTNPLAAIEGRVPGMIVTQSNGVPGSSFKVQIRGRNSIVQGSDPLFVIDGVPFAPGNSFLNQLYSSIGNPYANPYTAAGLSPLSLINPGDIESIEVLKDADATAIYGSRGANGVILITTRKGKAGKTKFSATLAEGTSRPTKTMSFLNTRDFVQMRKEAFSNDNIALSTDPSNLGYAPDILSWDTTRFTDIPRLLTGGSAQYLNAQVSFSGGDQYTQFLVSGGFHRQTTVFPGDNSDNQGGFHLNLNHNSTDSKFHSTFSAGYTSDLNNLLATDLSVYSYLPPDIPSLHDSNGNLKWQENGISYINPLSELLRKYRAQSENLTSNLQLSYKILATTVFRISGGYNTTQVNEKSIVPRTSIDPQSPALASSSFADNLFKSWIVEPQLEYAKQVGKGKINILVGGTAQELKRDLSTVSGQNYSSDALLGSIDGAGTVAAHNDFVQYHYAAFFGRLNFNWKDRYIMNLSGRKDGSSRFGPGRQFANFGAAGIAWIFSGENFFKNVSPLISFGKLRFSYGTTGNDQIGDYQYLDSWSPTTYPYQGISGISPLRLNNPDYSWEINRKFEGALELGLFNDRVSIITAFFRNRSSNQLINYALPIQTGFSNVNRNFNAVVQNSGWEFSLVTKNTTGKSIDWQTTLNITIHRNKLVSFPGLAASSYANSYIEGQSLSVLKGYKFVAVDPITGIYTFSDLDKDGSVSYPNDYAVLGNLDPKYYGGMLNTLKFKRWGLDIFVEFRKQTGRNYLYDQLQFIPGEAYNQPTLVLNRWQQNGQIRPVQKYTTTSGTDAYEAIVNYLGNSDAIYSDASYLRFKNIYLSYSLSGSALKINRIDNLRVFLQAQNVFTITGYKGADPETQSIYSLPPMRTFTIGINLNF